MNQINAKIAATFSFIAIMSLSFLVHGEAKFQILDKVVERLDCNKISIHCECNTPPATFFTISSGDVSVSDLTGKTCAGLLELNGIIKNEGEDICLEFATNPTSGWAVGDECTSVSFTCESPCLDKTVNDQKKL